MNIKKILTSLLLTIFLFTQNFAVNLAYALPDLPGAPDATNEVDQPDATDAPDEPASVEATDEAEEEAADAESSGEPKDNNEAPQAPEAPEADSEDNTGEVDASGEVGSVDIDTGNATAAGAINNIGNTNMASGSDSGVGGITIANNSNGTGSSNDGTVTLEGTDTTIQDNNANLNNGLNVKSNSGGNIASSNVGNSVIDSGNANSTGTILNSVNTNLEGAIVSEFNVIDDQVGDLVLDYAAYCISGCSAFRGINILNEKNGSESTNSSDVTLTSDELTFQNNDADVENTLALDANSGGNTANDNTGGSSEISTGDANVSGSVLNFLNNNIAGNVIYGVVNIFGELIGDIIVPEGYVDTNLAFPINMANKGNGSGSDNSTDLTLLTDDQVIQFNNADIINNLYIDANTGGNTTSDNTGGNNDIDTGDVTVDAQILNVANNNFVGGDWWIVLVNDAGNWLGKIFAPQGSFNGGNFAMSSGQANTDENGDINISNNKNGSDSVNTASVTDTQDSISVQTNNAKIVNNVSLTANTGDNSASRNTGGSSEIKTGDANVQFNLVNFLNNNFAGGNVFLTVVNVFGNWVGDFIAPGSEAQASNNESPAVGGANNISSQPKADPPMAESSSSSSLPVTQSVLGSTVTTKPAKNRIASISSGESDENESLALVNTFQPQTDVKQKTKINLAWGLLILPGVFILNILRKRFLG